MTDLHDMTEAEWDKCWAVNVKGQMALLRAALPTFTANKDGGSFIMTSSVAVRTLLSHDPPHATDATYRASQQPAPRCRIP